MAQPYEKYQLVIDLARDFRICTSLVIVILGASMISPISVVKLIRQHLVVETPEILRALLDKCPRSLDDQNWRWELNGFVSALVSTGHLHAETQREIEEQLFPESNHKRRQLARSKPFSIDVFTLSPSREARKYQYDVPALNPFDAYAKLAMRGSYNLLEWVEVVQVYRGSKDERQPTQEPLKKFDRDEIVQPRG